MIHKPTSESKIHWCLRRVTKQGVDLEGPHGIESEERGGCPIWGCRDLRCDSVGDTKEILLSRGARSTDARCPCHQKGAAEVSKMHGKAVKGKQLEAIVTCYFASGERRQGTVVVGDVDAWCPG